MKCSNFESLDKGGDRRLVLFLSCLLATGSYVPITGCIPQAKVRFSPRPSPEEMAEEVKRLSAVRPSVTSSTPASVGSLWPADDHVFFYGDRKALREGDILTINIIETAEGSNTANTDLSRKSSINARINNLFNAKSLFGTKLGEDIVNATAENSHQGSGTTSRKGNLVASMTAIVKEVLPNGNLVVQGSRSVVVNHEEQFMSVTGIVRPQDVNQNNVILSTQIADARITFGGVGVVADKQRTGWGTWIVDWLWPF